MEHRRSGGRLAAIIISIVLAVVILAAAGGYLAGCWWVSSQNTFFPGYHIENVDVGGMTVSQAASALKAELTGRTFSVWLDQQEGDPAMILNANQLGLLPDGESTDYTALAQAAYNDCRSGSFLSGGYEYYLSMRQGAGSCYVLPTAADAICLETAQSVAKKLSIMPVDAAYSMEGTSLVTLTPKDGRTVNARALADALNAVRLETEAANRKVVVPSVVLPAKVLTARQINSYIRKDMLNARYDAATDTILPEVVGIDFDIAAAQQLMDAAVPGEYATYPLTMTYPPVTTEILEPVMFRDVLAAYTTNVAGTAARKNNVQLSAKAIDGYVLNYGDIFSYNEVVGKRTAARGYQAAPSYVGGKTVDEIGGGICQTSSTLYMSCLLANLEITQRRPHRYATAYMPFGMDATVSWGGPDYQFTNNTNYPIRIETKYVAGKTAGDDGKLTVTLYGTKTDDISVKMSYKYLEKIPWTTVYEEDPTMAPGTEKVTTSAYTGHKVQTYRELYDGEGTLISKTEEAYSYYKARNRVVTRGPAVPEPPPEPVTPPQPEPPVTPEVPAVDPTPEIPESPATPETPADTPSAPDAGEVPPAADPAAPETPSAGDGQASDNASGTQDTPTMPDEALPPA